MPQPSELPVDEQTRSLWEAISHGDEVSMRSAIQSGAKLDEVVRYNYEGEYRESLISTYAKILEEGRGNLTPASALIRATRAADREIANNKDRCENAMPEALRRAINRLLTVNDDKPLKILKENGVDLLRKDEKGRGHAIAANVFQSIGNKSAPPGLIDMIANLGIDIYAIDGETGQHDIGLYIRSLFDECRYERYGDDYQQVQEVCRIIQRLREAGVNVEAENANGSKLADGEGSKKSIRLGIITGLITPQEAVALWCRPQADAECKPNRKEDLIRYLLDCESIHVWKSCDNAAFPGALKKLMDANLVTREDIENIEKSAGLMAASLPTPAPTPPAAAPAPQVSTLDAIVQSPEKGQGEGIV